MTTSGAFRKKLLSASVASVLGLTASGPVTADTYVFDIKGAFTMVNSAGAPVPNYSSPYVYYGDEYGWYGNRTPISGEMTYDTTTGQGTLIINPFFFFGDSPGHVAEAQDITIRFIGNGTCTNNFPDDPAQCDDGDLLLGNMTFVWGDTRATYPVTNVWDARGLLQALSTAVLGSVIEVVGENPASNDLNFEQNAKKPPKFFPLGPTPIAVTTWNTTNNDACEVKDPADPEYDSGRLHCAPGVPSGVLPLIADTVAGSPIVGTSFNSFNPNFDIRKLTVTCKNGLCDTTPPEISTRTPGPDAQNVDVRAKIIFSFTKPMQAETVVSGFSLEGPGGALAGTFSPSSGNATLFTFTPDDPLLFTTEYTATITDMAKDANDIPLSGAPVAWSFTTAEQSVATTCEATDVVPLGSNFTMVNKTGGKTGGTNDVVYSFEIDGAPIDIDDPDNLNTSVTDTKFNMKLASNGPTPFFGNNWTAHTIRVFGPGTYRFNTTCTTLQVVAGECAPNADESKNLTMEVGTGQIGAHMLFDWNTATNIDVINVWDRNAAWNTNPLNLDPPPAKGNRLDPDNWWGPAGTMLNPNTTWAFVSTDPDGDGVNGVQMVDGDFATYNANFNLGPSNSCLPGAMAVINTGAPESAGGCTISRNPTAVSILDKSEWLLIGGFLAWLGAVRRRFRRQA
jgi:hypothetical protein